MKGLSLSLALSLLCCLAGAGCGEESPSTQAAMVGSHAISRELVERWTHFDEGLRGAAGMQPRSPRLAKRATLQGLIEGEWVRAYARARHLDAAPAAGALRAFEESLGVNPALVHHLREEARLSEEALRRRAVAVALENEIAEQYARQRLPVGGRAIAVYYQRHGSGLGRPEERTVDFVVSASKDEAQEAKAALERREPWAAVAERYSVAQVRREVGWRLEAITARYLRALLSRKAATAVFAAPAGRLIGPKPFEGGQILFQVLDVKPASRPPFPLVRDAIRNRLIQRQREAALVALRSRLRAENRSRTTCAADFGLSWCQPLHP